MYKFKMPIGDWSRDGHGECDYYLVSSNKSVEEVREIHFKIKEVTGIDLEEICSEYEDNYCYEEDIIKKLIDIGFDVKGKCDIDGDLEDTKDNNCGIGFDSKTMVELWIYLLKFIDKDLSLEFAKEQRVPMLPFYGFDEKNRHISFVGYGLFD